MTVDALAIGQSRRRLHGDPVEMAAAQHLEGLFATFTGKRHCVAGRVNMGPRRTAPALEIGISSLYLTSPSFWLSLTCSVW